MVVWTQKEQPYLIARVSGRQLKPLAVYQSVTDVLKTLPN